MHSDSGFWNQDFQVANIATVWWKAIPVPVQDSDLNHLLTSPDSKIWNFRVRSHFESDLFSNEILVTLVSLSVVHLDFKFRKLLNDQKLQKDFS